MDEVKVTGYESYPEAYEKLLKELSFPTDDEAIKKMLLNSLIASLLHY